MNAKAAELRERMARIREKMNEQENEKRSIEYQLDNLERTCQHDFTAPEYIPEHREGYTIPGDAPGTMGVDWRGPTYVPSETIDKWRRVCKRCGKVEVTKDVTADKPVPKF